MTSGPPPGADGPHRFPEPDEDQARTIESVRMAHFAQFQKAVETGKPMNTDLMKSMFMAGVQHSARKAPLEANLGCATTMQIVAELESRCRVADVVGEKWPSYRTVESI